jgi:hypothetical protein
MLRRLAVASTIVGLGGISAVASAESNWLEPEDSVFGEGFRQDDLRLRAALLGEDHYRQCQLVSVPSFEPVNVVFIRDDDAEPTVVSRTLRPEVWAKLTSPQKEHAKRVGSRDERANIPPERIQAAVETRTARLDRATADLIIGVCEEVLLRTQYAEEETRGNDGVTYHAAHRGHGRFLSGKVWSPRRGTVAGDFVEMEEMLAAFVATPVAQREAAKSALLAKAKALLKRVRETPPTHAAEARVVKSAERAVELVALLVKGVAARKVSSQVAHDLNGVLDVTKAMNRWKVETDIPGVLISLAARSMRGRITEAILDADVIAGLSLDALQRRFGPYSIVQESTLSSVRFTPLAADVTMFVDLLDSKINPESVVKRVTVQRELKRD